MVNRVLVATDRSESASRAVNWAADMAERFGAQLLVLQIIVPQTAPGTEAGQAEATRAAYAAEDLKDYAFRLAGDRGLARVVIDEDVARAIVETAHEERVDVIVVGNVGMRGRKEFLLGNVPNRVSHLARTSVIIVNTAETDGDRRRPLLSPGPAVTVRTRSQEPPDVEGRLLGRASRIGAVMAKFGVRHLFARGDGEVSERAQAQRLRSAMEELGPTFAKLGQILSTRPDLLPPAFVEELATLQDRVTPLSEREVVTVMEEELEVPWEDVFESIDPTPMAAGTIAQVHRAALATGERVVVKVQRPTAERDILLDLGLLERFAERTGDRPAFRQVVDMHAIIEHLSTSLRRELDFRQEAANIEQMRRVLSPYPRLEVPGVYTDFSTRRLLVMEEVQGVPVRQAPMGEARTEAARQLLESYYRQILTDGFFHADPHPGNLMWWKDRIYFLDFGMVGEVGPDIRELLMLLLMAFWQEDVSFLSDVVLMLSGEDQRSDIDIGAFTEELGSLMARYRHLSLKEIQLGPILQEITEISLRHDVRLPASLALTGKALAQMQLATAELDPTLDPFSVAGQFVVKNLTGRIKEGLDPKRMFYEAQKLRVRFARLIESVERLAGARPGPKLQVYFRGTERLEGTIQRAGRRLSLALAAGSSLVGAAITASSANVADWVPIGLGSVGAALTLGLVGDLVGRRR
jgi:predicted unusual protein kinase regulating ubiquinone biosynthesis (AarF/ABC1/UbiB family)/nucleotide-binding universal stress UspA family protein